MTIFNIWLRLAGLFLLCVIFAVGFAVSAEPAKQAKQAKQESLKLYLVDVQKRISSNYYPPKCSPPVTPRVTVRIDSAGAIRSCKLSRSSGVALYDRCALEAIEGAREFKPLPEGWSTMDVEISFDYSMFSPAGAVRILERKTTDEREVKKGEMEGKRVPQKVKPGGRKSRKGKRG